MSALALLVRPIANGWAVVLTNGQELVRYRGIGAKRRAIRYLVRYIDAQRTYGGLQA